MIQIYGCWCIKWTAKSTGLESLSLTMKLIADMIHKSQISYWSLQQWIQLRNIASVCVFLYSCVSEWIGGSCATG